MKERMYKKWLLLIVVAFVGLTMLSVGHSISVLAQGEVNTTTNEPTVTDVAAQQISGEVLKVEGNRITVETDQGIKEVMLTGNVRLTRNGTGAQVDDIRPNDQVSFTQTPNGEVLNFSVTSGALMDMSKYLVPVALLAVVLIGLGFALMRKGQERHIKTSIAHS